MDKNFIKYFTGGLILIPLTGLIASWWVVYTRYGFIPFVTGVILVMLLWFTVILLKGRAGNDQFAKKNSISFILGGFVGITLTLLLVGYLIASGLTSF